MTWMIILPVREKLQWVSDNHWSRSAIVYDHNTAQPFFIWTAHHAIFDCWSTRLLMEEVEEAYNGLQVSPRTDFRHFVKYSTRLKTEAAKAFWRTYLSDANSLSFPRIPSAGFRPLADSCREHHVKFSRKSHSNVTTPSMIRAAWALLLGRYAETDDVVFGTTLSGRSAPVLGVDQMIGPTITTVPMRLSLDRTLSIAGFIQDVQDKAKNMMEFEHVGLQDIRRLGDTVEAALEFQTLPIVQPPEPESGVVPRLLDIDDAFQQAAGFPHLCISPRLYSHSRRNAYPSGL